MSSLEDIRLRVTLHYDGTRYFGWQLQPDAPTVQGEVERIVQRLTGAHRTVLASGRTDRGVHATGQVASVLVPGTWTAEGFGRALNALLPADIWVEQVADVPLAFHPRYDALERTYVYRVGTAPGAHSPFIRPYCWPLDATLDGACLSELAGQVLGERSFKAFARAGQPERGERCRVIRSEWRPWDLGWELVISADRFLHHMVRYLVGTMVEIARGRRAAAELDRLLGGDDDLRTSPPAPPSGLFLAHVRYPGDAAPDLASLSTPFTLNSGVV
ncbi:MAG: tRNA pseudouridine(38-40) synthase TruA [Gemmatimonadota bacterium]